MTSAVREWFAGLVVDGPYPPRRATVYRALVTVAVLISTAIAILDTEPDIWGEARGVAFGIGRGALLLMTFDYGLRLLLAWLRGAVGRYAVSAYGLFDFLAVVPLMISLQFGVAHDAATAFGILGMLKLARYSPALETLGVVVMAEFRPLMSALFIMLLLAVFTSTLLYFVERDINPGFSSVPKSMWWSVVTLATVGYGDVVPATALGRVLGAGVAILGLCMFALPASILASGFNEEMRRQNFVSTWHLVAKVPFFTKLQASQIAEIAQLLKSYRAVTGEILMREGEQGASMYFIVSGQVEVHAPRGTFVLGAGEFFGEIALIEQCPRTATVKVLTRCQLLILDAREFTRFVAGYPNLMASITETARARLSQHIESV